jgi:multiple antibiotic resistance protein
VAELLDLRFLGSVIVTLLVIMDPPGVVPIFLGLAGKRPVRERSRLALQATATSFGVIVLFAVLGQQVLSYLKISLPALQGAGGLLLLLVSLELLTGQSEKQVAERDVNVALVPLGTPVLAGPGAIVATILFAQKADSTSQYFALALGVVIVHILIWSAMRFSSGIAKVLGDAGITIVTRIAGLLLAAIGVQLIADAIFGFIKASGS